MNNSLDTSGTRQQMLSRLTAFSKATKARSEDQRPESKEASDQCPEDGRGDSSPSDVKQNIVQMIVRLSHPLTHLQILDI